MDDVVHTIALRLVEQNEPRSCVKDHLCWEEQVALAKAYLALRSLAAGRGAVIEECAKAVEAEADKMEWASRPSVMGRYLADKLRGQR